ncbi:unnamed protein product [Rotaria sp. Silwood1]|nr:unnamed protein product [Rotaria sp. Silwood1]CAF1675010.1 unnamed protein product [Rotaria sp. Silwood1]
MQHNDTSSNNLFTNIERLGTRDLLSYGQLSYNIILTSIQSNNTLPLSVNSLFDRLFFHHGFDLTLLLQILIEIYVIQINSILLEQRTKEYNELYINLIERNYKLITKTYAYTLCLFLLESHEVDLNSYDIWLLLIKDDNLTQKLISISLEKLLIVEQTIIDSSSIISSSDNILTELVEELYARTKQSSTLPYEALLLLRPLSLLLAHISFFFVL